LCLAHAFTTNTRTRVQPSQAVGVETEARWSLRLPGAEENILHVHVRGGAQYRVEVPYVISRREESNANGICRSTAMQRGAPRLERVALLAGQRCTRWVVALNTNGPTSWRMVCRPPATARTAQHSAAQRSAARRDTAQLLQSRRSGRRAWAPDVTEFGSVML
jgi:hypothetical protein